MQGNNLINLTAVPGLILSLLWTLKMIWEHNIFLRTSHFMEQIRKKLESVKLKSVFVYKTCFWNDWYRRQRTKCKNIEKVISFRKISAQNIPVLKNNLRSQISSHLAKPAHKKLYSLCFAFAFFVETITQRVSSLFNLCCLWSVWTNTETQNVLKYEKYQLILTRNSDEEDQ